MTEPTTLSHLIGGLHQWTIYEWSSVAARWRRHHLAARALGVSAAAAAMSKLLFFGPEDLSVGSTFPAGGATDSTLRGRSER